MRLSNLVDCRSQFRKPELRQSAWRQRVDLPPPALTGRFRPRRWTGKEDFSRAVSFPKQGNSGLQILTPIGPVFNAIFRSVETERSDQLAAEPEIIYSGGQGIFGAKRGNFERERGILYDLDDSCVICLRSVYAHIWDIFLLAEEPVWGRSNSSPRGRARAPEEQKYGRRTEG